MGGITISSTNKTEHYGLNSWLGSDVPQRSDFNTDNELIDGALNAHETDSVAHITEEERNTWNSSYYIGYYYGDGTSGKKIKTNCPFSPAFGIVYAMNHPMVRADFNNSIHYSYSGFVAERGGTLGLELDGPNLIVTTSPSKTIWDEWKNLNCAGATFVYILFR